MSCELCVNYTTNTLSCSQTVPYIHFYTISPAFNCAILQWVAGVGAALRVRAAERAALDRASLRGSEDRGPRRRFAPRRVAEEVRHAALDVNLHRLSAARSDGGCDPS